MASSFYVTVIPTSFFPKTNILSIPLSKSYDPHTKFYPDFRDRLNITKAFLIQAIFEVSQVALVVKNLPANANVGDVRDTGQKIPWRRKWQPIPVFLPGESHGQRRLVGYSPWGLKELDTTEATQQLSTRVNKKHKFKYSCFIVNSLGHLWFFNSSLPTITMTGQLLSPNPCIILAKLTTLSWRQEWPRDRVLANRMWRSSECHFQTSSIMSFPSSSLHLLAEWRGV